MFFKNHWLIFVVITSVLSTIQVMFLFRMIFAKKASDVVPHLVSQLIAFIVWASTGTVAVFYGVDGVAIGTMFLVALLILSFFVIVQRALAEIAGGRSQ